MNLFLLSIFCYYYSFFFLLIALTDNVRSLSNLRINHTPNTTSKQRFNILPTYRGSTSAYDPSKSPLFSAGNRVSKIYFPKKKKTQFHFIETNRNNNNNNNKSQIK